MASSCSSSPKLGSRGYPRFLYLVCSVEVFKGSEKNYGLRKILSATLGVTVFILFWGRQGPVGYSLEERYVLSVAKVMVIARIKARVSGLLLKSFLEIQRDVFVFSIEERLGLWGHFPCGHGHDDSKGRGLLHSVALGCVVFPSQIEHPPVPFSHSEFFGLPQCFHYLVWSWFRRCLQFP